MASRYGSVNDGSSGHERLLPQEGVTRQSARSAAGRLHEYKHRHARLYDDDDEDNTQYVRNSQGLLGSTSSAHISYGSRDVRGIRTRARGEGFASTNGPATSLLQPTLPADMSGISRLHQQRKPGGGRRRLYGRRPAAHLLKVDNVGDRAGEDVFGQLTDAGTEVEDVDARRWLRVSAHCVAPNFDTDEVLDRISAFIHRRAQQEQGALDTKSRNADDASKIFSTSSGTNLVPASRANSQTKTDDPSPIAADDGDDDDKPSSVVVAGHTLTLYPEALHIQLPRDDAIDFGHPRDVFIHSYGCITFFNISVPEEIEFMCMISGTTNEAAMKSVIEETSDDFEFRYGSGIGGFRVKNDHIVLQNTDVLLRLSISFAMAQCVKINVYEDITNREITANQDVPQQLATTGDVPFDMAEIRKKMGRLFIVRNDIHLHHGILDTPEFLWENDRYKKAYDRVVEYLEINKRIASITRQLAIIKDLYTLMMGAVETKQAHRLEWIIIWLIIVEVVLEAGAIGLGRLWG